jgi:hypothetical protein
MRSSIAHQNGRYFASASLRYPGFRLISVAPVSSGPGAVAQGRAAIDKASLRAADPAYGSKRGYPALPAELAAFRARAMAECRRPAPISPAEAATLNPIARAVARDHDRGR